MCSTAGVDSELDYERAQALSDRINELAAHISAATCRWLELIADFDRGEGHVQFGFGTCAEWLSWSCSISPGTARDQMRVARALEEFPRIRASFASGVLSYSKVRAMVRIATAENEDYLLQLGEHCTAAQLERTVRGYRRCTSVDLDEANVAHERRYLSYCWDDDGFLNIRGRLTAEEGALVMQALDAGREALRNAAHTPKGQENVSAETETAEATAADALALMAETLLTAGANTRTGGARTELVVHVEADTLASDDDPHGMCHIDEGPGLHPETARRLGCDAALVRIIERDGRPLSVGRKTRTISPAMRRALQARDKGCCYPGCNRKRWVDGHHIKHWALGGETKLSNLALLCNRHHRLVHEGGYKLEQDGKNLRFRHPCGWLIPAVPKPRPGHEARLRAANRRHAPDIGPTTCMPVSRGERMDRGMAVDGLLQADGYFDTPQAERAPPG